MENKQVCDAVLSEYQVRKSGRQKRRFAGFVQEQCERLGLPFSVEDKKGLIRNRNIVVGDVNKARIILTAHYDTCAWMPIPNFCTPKNIFIFMLYQLILLGLFWVISIGITGLFTLFISGVFFKTIANFVFLLLLLQIVFGFPNKHTANDNTSGVATLLCLMQTISTADRDKVAFVFFDNEEVGLVGSSAFKKRHRKEIADKLLINFDCVSDGDHFLFVSKKQAVKSDEYPLLESILEEEAPVFNKKAEFVKASRALYPSDQLIYPKSIGVVALKKSPVLGLYLDRIHTSFDTRFDNDNLAFLSHSFAKFISQI